MAFIMSIELKQLLDELREELCRVAEGRRFSDPEVVAVSQKLDRVLEEYWIADLMTKYK